MERLTAVLFLFSLFGLGFFIRKYVGITWYFVPLMSGVTGTLILYAGGLAGMLAQTSVLLFLLGIAGGFLGMRDVIRRGRMGNPPGIFLCLFLLGACLFGGLIWNLKLIHYDNFSHWAVIVKYMLCTDRFPDASADFVVFKDYPPGSGVWIYYVCRFLGHSQGKMLLAQNSLIFSCFLAVFGIVEERRRFLLYAFLGAGSAVMSYLNLTVRINNLLVDFLLPVLAMSVVAVVRSMKEEKVRMSVCVALICGYTILVKDSGLFFCAPGFLYYVWAMLFCGSARQEIRMCTKNLFTRVGLVFLSAVTAFAPYAGWKWYLAAELSGFTGKFAFGSEVQTLPASMKGELTRKFFHSTFSMSERSFQMFLLCTLLTAGAVLGARIFLKRKWKLWKIWMLAVALVVVYYLGLLSLYLYTMPVQEAVRLAGFDRYTCSVMTLFAGILVMGAEWDMERSFAVDIDRAGAYRAYSSPEAKRRYQFTVLILMIIGVNFLYSEFNGLLAIQRGYADTLPGIVERTVGDRWNLGEGEDASSYLVAAADEKDGQSGRVSDGEVRYVCRYFLYAPHVDVVTYVDADTVEKELPHYDYILVLDEETVETSLGAAPSVFPQIPGLYKVQDLLYSYQNITGRQMG